MAASKVDFKRELRAVYSAGSEPVIVDVPELAFLMIDGHGDPNTAPEYAKAVQALYPVAYAAKFAVKRASDGPDYAVSRWRGCGGCLTCQRSPPRTSPPGSGRC